MNQLKDKYPDYEFSTFTTSGNVVFYQARKGLQDVASTSVDGLAEKMEAIAQDGDL